MKSKMYYNLTIMMVAEGRRDIGMFPFGPIMLQNIADGRLTFKDAFNIPVVKKNATKGKNAGKQTTESQNVTARSIDTLFPPAWEGSKKIEEDVEEHVLKGGKISDLARRYLDVKSLSKKMEYQIAEFFKNDNRRNFSVPPLNTLQGADFTDQKGALKAIVNYIKGEYFESIPAMHSSDLQESVTNPKRAKNRQEMEIRSGQRDVLLSTHSSLRTQSLNAASLELIVGEMDTFVESGKKRVQGPRARHHQRSHNVSRKRQRDLDSADSFSDTDSENQMMKQDVAFIRGRQQRKRQKANEPEFQAGMREAEAGKDTVPNKYDTPTKQLDYQYGHRFKRTQLKNLGYCEGADGKVKSMKDNKFYVEGYDEGKKKRDQVISVAKAIRGTNTKPDSSAVVGEDVPEEAIELLRRICYATFYTGNPE